LVSRAPDPTTGHFFPVDSGDDAAGDDEGNGRNDDVARDRESSLGHDWSLRTLDPKHKASLAYAAT
jgi:hypothetical protein